MRRVEAVATGSQRAKPWSRHAAAAGLGLWLGLSSTCALAAFDCSVSTPGLAFGSYDVFAAGVTNGNATLSVTCLLDPGSKDATINYTVTLSSGNSNSFLQRQMKSGTNVLAYNLFTSNGYSVVWGDGTGSTGTVLGSMKLVKGSNPSQTNMHTVYGQIPAVQDVAVANNYADQITVTVTY